MRKVLVTLAAFVGLAVAAGPASAIVGGSVSAPGAWPWAAAVEGTFTDPGYGTFTFFCSGSLIGERWVLTAAHCALDALTGAVYEGITYTIVIGQSNIDHPPPGNTYTAGATDVIPLNTGGGGLLTGSVVGDLALIRLDRPSTQQAIRIPGAGVDPGSLTKPGTLSTVIGWGLTDENAPAISLDLREVAVPIVSDTDCAAAYPTLSFAGYAFGFDPITMICAGLPQGGKDSCSGDSGGPLMVPDGANGWLQIGVTSWGEGCAEAGLPGVYGRLAGLYGFIVASLEKDPVAPTAAPLATTDPPSGITRRSATIAGSVTPNGLATDYVIELGPTKRYGVSLQGYAGDGSTPIPVSGVFSGLRPGRTYHVRVDAVSVAGVAHGADRTFTTPPAKKTQRSQTR